MKNDWDTGQYPDRDHMGSGLRIKDMSKYTHVCSVCGKPSDLIGGSTELCSEHLATLATIVHEYVAYGRNMEEFLERLREKYIS